MSSAGSSSPGKKLGRQECSKPTSPGSKISRSKNEAIVKKEENYLARCTNYRLTSGYEVSICNCKHIRKIRIGERHSICNPQRWLCNTCLTTESVWACLSCPNVACGRYIKEHALTHYQESGHPLAIDVNELYVFCYKCDDYVLNDNNSSDIKVLRETLLAIRYQNFTGTTRSGHTLRSAMITEQEDLEMRRKMQQDQLDRDDRLFTAIWHSRFVRQRKAFRQWLRYIRWKRTRDVFLDDESDSNDCLEEVSLTENLENEDNSEPLKSPTEDCNKKEDDTVTTSWTNLLELPPSPKLAELPPDLKLEIVSCFSESLDVSPESRPEVEEVTPPTTTKESKDSVTTENVTKSPPKKIDFQLKSLSVEVVDLKKQELVPDVPFPSGKTSRGSDLNDDFPNPIPLASGDVEHSSDNEEGSSCEKQSVSAIPLNIHSRPKRVNAAGRYKEIFSSLGIAPLKRDFQSGQTSRRNSTEPPTKKRAVTIPAPGGRRSDRIRKIEEKKEIVVKKKRAPVKRGFQWTREKRAKQKQKSFKFKKEEPRKKSSQPLPKKKSQKSYGSRPSRARRLIGGPASESRNSCRPPSLYDNIPNKAVTSLIPGVTGLRNLGNTCYLNSIIQVLGHLQKFRLCLLALREVDLQDSFSEKDDQFSFVTAQGKVLRSVQRRSTVELYNEQIKPTALSTRSLERKKSGLNGGRSPDDIGDDPLTLSPGRSSHRAPTSPACWSSSLSLCNELDHLYQVMWSGKWKLVSPYHFLHSVWSLIPSFRGYTQQDAQEFLCELLDKIVSELKRSYNDSLIENRIVQRILQVVEKVFEGRLKSEVRCLECDNISSTVEPFWDLSLEFPERYHKISSKRKSSSAVRPSTTSSEPCTLYEMLSNFTSPETLEGGRVYGCSKCNLLQQSKGCSQKKKPTRKSSQMLTEAEKQLKVLELPQVLRFHLKRFRWIGRNHREKISVHVDFPSELDMRPYCWNPQNVDSDLFMSPGSDKCFMYDLSAVVMHHGRGFGSGHYTANCWNGIGKFWVHCNDSNLELCSIEDVMASQAYILFYTLRGLDPQPHILSPPLTPTVSSSTQSISSSLSEEVFSEEL